MPGFESSVVRVSKIATGEAARCERIGRLPGEAAAAVAGYLRRTVVGVLTAGR